MGWSVITVVALAAVMLLCLAAMPTTVCAAADLFPDVPVWHRYRAAVEDLASRGIVQGFPDGTFRMGDPVSRQQFAKMVCLAMDWTVSETDACPFSDVELSPPGTLYPDHYVAVAAAHGVTLGVSPRIFDPYGCISRYQAISMVARAAQSLGAGILSTPPEAWYQAPWVAEPTHGSNGLRMAWSGLLGALPLDVFDFWAPMERDEVAQILYNLRQRMAFVIHGPEVNTEVVTITARRILQVPRWGVALCDGILAWTDERSLPGGYEWAVMTQSLREPAPEPQEIRISPHRIIEKPDLCGDHVVWTELAYDSTHELIASGDVFLCSLGGDYERLPNDGRIPEAARVGESYVVWTAATPDPEGGSGLGSYELMAYELATGAVTQLTQRSVDWVYADTDGKYVAWLESVDPGSPRHAYYLYDASAGTERLLWRVPYYNDAGFIAPEVPQVVDDLVVWSARDTLQDNRTYGAVDRIYVHHISTGVTEIVAELGASLEVAEVLPRVHTDGRSVVWVCTAESARLSRAEVGRFVIMQYDVGTGAVTALHAEDGWNTSELIVNRAVVDHSWLVFDAYPDASLGARVWEGTYLAELPQ